MRRTYKHGRVLQGVPFSAARACSRTAGVISTNIYANGSLREKKCEQVNGMYPSKYLAIPLQLFWRDSYNANKEEKKGFER